MLSPDCRVVFSPYTSRCGLRYTSRQLSFKLSIQYSGMLGKENNLLYAVVKAGNFEVKYENSKTKWLPCDEVRKMYKEEKTVKI